jgi:dCTP deaminase
MGGTVSLLRRSELHEALAASGPNRLVVTPLLDDDQVGDASIDLRLGTEFLSLSRSNLPGLNPAEADPRAIERIHKRFLHPFGEPLWLRPGQFLLGSTLEWVRLPNDLAGMLIGRSSWARLGLVVEMAGLVQPGFAGALTYELANVTDSAIALYPGLRIAQLAIYRLKPEEAEPGSPKVVGYSGKYGSGFGPAVTRAWEDKEMTKLKQLGVSLGSTRRPPDR